MTGALRSLLSFGSGVGIEIAGPPNAETLRVAVARIRPGSARLLDELTIADIGHHAAGAWGNEYASLLRKHGMSHVAATVLLPRRDVIVRLLSLPGVSDKDLPSAVSFQLDGLHPYAEEEAVSSWARLPDTSSVLVVIARRTVVERYSTLFSEAGIKTGSFTCSAAELYSARRLSGAPAQNDLLTYAPTENGVEIYGESAARPVFSALFDAPAEQAANMAAAELRLGSETPLHHVDALLGTAPGLAYAAALGSAVPLLSLPVNLLPETMRQTSSRAWWIPAAALAAAALLLAGALGAFPAYEKKRYLESLNAEIAKIAPAAKQASDLDRQIGAARHNTLLLDQLRAQSKSDMDVLGELTHILPPPTWLNTLELARNQVSIAGETAQAASLLSTLDASPLFQNSEFTSPPVRVKDGEAFRIKSVREGAPIAEAGK